MAGKRPAVMALALLLTVLFFPLAGYSIAQNQGEWSKPELIYETEAAINYPYVVGDGTGVTHLFWREFDEDESDSDSDLQAIIYSNDIGGRWNPGRDIIVMKSVVAPAAAVDANGLIHLLWQSTNNTLYHSLATTESAHSAQGWAQPEPIAATNSSAHIQTGIDNVMHVVFPGIDTTGVYYIRYDNETHGWSFPVNISAPASSNTSSDFTRLAIGSDGTLHVVWTEYLLPGGWPPTGIYYANSTDGGATWSRATELEGEGSVQANIAVDSRGRVHVAWNRMVGIGGRYHRWSEDGGQSWSPLAEIAPAGQGGTEGPPQLVVDSADALHLLTTFNGCAQYATWVEGVWTSPVCISGREAMASGFIESPTMTVTNGNQLHAVFWDDRKRLWHATMTTNAPFIPSVALIESAPPTIAASPAAVEVTQSVATPIINLSTAPPGDGELLGPAQALLPATAIAGALLGFVILIKLLRSR